ncbi:MAG: hypothetical protein V4654_06160 [Bdellovibrionota bacterium]
MKQLLVTALMLVNFSWAMAQDCRLPVCNMTSKIEEMKVMNQDGRFQVIKEMRTKYRAETDAGVLNNLLEFSGVARALMVEMGDEAWVVREPDYLKNSAIVGLVKFDKINDALMIKRFSQVTDEGSAFDILAHWSTNVDKLDNVEDVLAVTAFAEYAKKWAIDTKQEAYVAREAEKVMILGAQHISRLNPSHEGSYEVKVTCKPTPKDCGMIPKAITHMSIFDTLGAKGLAVNLAGSQMSAPFYIYTSALLTNNGTHIRGISTDATPTTRISEIDLDVDMKTGKITGRLIDAQFIGEMIIEGTPVRRMSEFYTDQGPSRVVDVTEILGHYKGQLAGIENSELVVSRYASGELVAILDIGSGQNLAFRAGNYNSKKGVLSFSGQGGTMGDRKLVLALRRNNKGREVLTGFMMTATPKTPAAEFAKVK